MNGTDEEIESVLRTALHDAADQIDVRPTNPTATADELVERRRVTLSCASRGRDPRPVSSSRWWSQARSSSLGTTTRPRVDGAASRSAAAGGCTGTRTLGDYGDGTVSAFDDRDRGGLHPDHDRQPTQRRRDHSRWKQAYVTDVVHNTVSVIDDRDRRGVGPHSRR